MPTPEVQASVGTPRACAIAKAAPIPMIVATTTAPMRNVSDGQELSGHQHSPPRLADEQIS